MTMSHVGARNEVRNLLSGVARGVATVPKAVSRRTAEIGLEQARPG